MIISGIEKELGATYEARRIVDNELVYGIAIIKVNEEKSYLIQRFETDDFTDGTPALAYYIPVRTDSVISLEDIEEDPSCQNCGECICMHCDHREGNHSVDCIGRCSNCGDIPIHECDEYKYADW